MTSLHPREAVLLILVRSRTVIDRPRDAWINEVKWLGLTITPSYVGKPECDGVIERFMRTLKKQCLYLHRFQTLAEAQRIIGEFIARYNAEWLIERLGHRTHSPSPRRRPSDSARDIGELGPGRDWQAAARQAMDQTMAGAASVRALLLKLVAATPDHPHSGINVRCQLLQRVEIGENVPSLVQSSTPF